MIERYEYLVFSPVAQIEEANVGTWKKGTVKNGPATLASSPSEPISSPTLAAGTYLVAFRAAGKPEAPKDDVEAEGEDGAADKLVIRQDDDEGLPVWMAQIDPMEDNLLFFEAKSGELTASLPVRKAPEIVKSQAPAGARTARRSRSRTPTASAPSSSSPASPCALRSPHRLRGKVLAFELTTTVEPGLMDRAGWRGLK